MKLARGFVRNFARRAREGEGGEGYRIWGFEVEWEGSGEGEEEGKEKRETAMFLRT